MLGRKPELRQQRASASGRGERADERAVAVGRAEHVPAPVQVQDRRVSAERQSGDTGRGDGPHRDLGRQRQLSAERLEDVAHRLQRRLAGGDRHDRRPHPHDPRGQLAADRLRGGDRLIQRGQHPAGAL
jgi:hypothetical protein